MLTDSHMIDGDGDGVDMSYGNVTASSDAAKCLKALDQAHGGQEYECLQHCSSLIQDHSESSGE